MIPENTTSGGRFKLDVLKNKAKKSLTSSLENIFSRVRLTERCQQFSQISLTVKSCRICVCLFVLWLQFNKYVMKLDDHFEMWRFWQCWWCPNYARKLMVRPHKQIEKANFWMISILAGGNWISWGTSEMLLQKYKKNQNGYIL